MSKATILYSIQGGEVDDDDINNAFEVPWPPSGRLRLNDLMRHFNRLPLLDGQGDSAGWHFVLVRENGQKVDLDSPAAIVDLNRNGIATIQAVPLGE